MKKFLLILIAAVTLAAPRATAQDTFNKLAVGVSVGLDGVGLEAATPVGDHFQLRAGYSFFPYTYSNTFDFGTGTIGGTKREFKNIPVKGTLWGGGVGKILADYYFGSSSFRVTAGIFAGSGKLLKAEADFRSVLTRDEYGTLGIGTDTGKTISSDANGMVHADGKVFNVLPYLGLGVGKAISDNRVTVTFDLGAVFDGGIKLQSYNYLRNTMDSSRPVEAVGIDSAALKNYDNGWIDKIGKIPVFPMLKIGVFVKLI